MSRPPRGSWREVWPTAAGAALVIVVLVALMTLRDRQQHWAEWQQRLTADVIHKRDQVSAWIGAARADGALVAQFPIVGTLLRSAASDDTRPGHLDEVLRLFVAIHGHAGVYVFGTDGRLLESVEDRPASAAVLQALSAVARAAALDVSVVDEPDSARWWLAVPTAVVSSDEPQSPRRLGTVLLLDSPERHLWPLFMQDVGGFETKETVVVRRENDMVRYLSPLRFRPENEIVRVPFAPQTYSAAAALLGAAQFGERIDYRGRKVLAASHPVPGTDWAVNTEIDRAEAFAEWNQRTMLLIVLGASVWLAVAALTSAFERRGRGRRLEAELAQERQLLEVFERYRLLSDHATDIMLFLRPDGAIIDANAAAQRAYQLGRHELMQRTLFDLRPPEARTAVAAQLQQVLQEPLVFEAEQCRGDGTRFPAETSAVAAVTGDAPIILQVIRDVSERRVAEARFRAIFETVSMSVAVLDLAGHFVEVNDAGCRLLGYSRPDLIGRHFELVAPPGREAADRQRFAGLIAGQGLGDMIDLPFCRGDGELIWVRMSSGLIRDAAGRPQFLSVVAQDITERRQAELEVLRLNAELEQRVEERTAALAAANRELEWFNHSVSHDLRAPLRHIEGFVRMLEQNHGDELPDKARHYLDVIGTATQRMGQLIDALLALSRVGQAPLRQQSVDLAEVAHGVFGELVADLPARRRELIVADLPGVQGDPVLLRQLMVNLLSNALKFTRPVELPRIAVGVEERNGSPTLFVRDNGVGFDPAYAHKLFGVFQRLHTDSQFEGTGIGLSIVRRIVERHGGTICAESTPGGGATFYFTLPGLRKVPILEAGRA